MYNAEKEMMSARKDGFEAGSRDAASGASDTPCPYPSGSWLAVEWEAGYTAGEEYFTSCNPWA